MATLTDSCECYWLVLEAKSWNKTDLTNRKGNDTLSQKIVSFLLSSILFEVTWAFGKMCKRESTKTSLAIEVNLRVQVH